MGLLGNPSYLSDNFDQNVSSDPQSAVTVEPSEPTELSSRPTDAGHFLLHEHKQNQPAELDSLEAEYLEATDALQRRREARRQRRIRLQKHIEHAQQRMREADLERKRWIPARILRRVRQFFVESGIVQTPQAAVLISTFALLTATGLSVFLYRYWFS